MRRRKNAPREPLPPGMDRRTFVELVAAGMGSLVLGCGDRARNPPPGEIVSPAEPGGPRPGIPSGVQSGDVTATSAVIWAACDRPARMRVRWSTSDKLASATTVAGPVATPATAFATKFVVDALPPGQDVFYEVVFEALDRPGTVSAPALGHLRTASAGERDVHFLWSGDTAGQGWGINVDWGGMRIYDPMRELDPDFFLHSGDLVYADGPFPAEIPLPDGTIWKNLTTELTSKVAETLDEFRGNYQYNFLDERLRAFHARVPVLAQWDDHETLNNWYPGEILTAADARYQVKSVDLLAERARRAFLEWTPVRIAADDPQRIHRAFHFGPLLDVFMLDMRSYRGSNTPGREAKATSLLGSAQLKWLTGELAASRATWKVIASDLPIGLVIADDDAFEGAAQGNGPALGRELEIAELLAFIAARDIRNVVWLTADVHYTAAHHYDPARARFTRFKPFWEFVSGPLHAGTFGPNPLDDTFGPEIRFQKAPPPGQENLPPSAGYQFFGDVRISAKDRSMTVILRDLTGAALFTQVLPAEPPGRAG